MNKGKLDKGFGGRPKKSVTEKMERVTVFIPALLVPRYPPLRIRELVVSDSLRSAASRGADAMATRDAPTPVAAPVADRMALAKAALADAESKTALKPFGDTETSVRTYGLSPLRSKLAKRFNDLLMCPHIDEGMIGRWIEEGIEKASGDF